MSKLNPDKYGGALSPTKTTQMEVRVQNADAGLAWDSNDFQVLGNAVPASFNPQPTMNKTEARYGVTSVTHEQHMSERDSAFSISLNEATSRARQLANATDLPVVFDFATTGFTQTTVAAGPTNNMFFELADASGLTTDDQLHFVFFNSDPLKKFVEERYVKRVVGDIIYLRHPLSKTPEAASAVTRIVDITIRDGGTNYQALHANLKTTAVDKSIHVLDYPDTRIDGSLAKQGSNSELMGTDLTFKAMAKPETISGTEEPIFSAEHMIPRNVAKAIS